MSLSSSLGGLNLRKAPRITPQEFSDLRAFIYEKTGIDIPERRQYLVENRLGSRLQELKLKSYAEYLKYLRYSPGRDGELSLLCEKVTTNETSFFRDQRQLDAFNDHALQELVDAQTKAGRKELHIWSAGCSSGEEPYTLSMMLHEMLRMTIIGWRIRITANDLSPAMIAKAKAGVYGDYAFRTTPKEMVRKYFTQEPEGYKVHPKVQKLVNFSTINLNDKIQVGRVPKAHVVFCRNVIIYFDEEMKKRVINAFYDKLLPGGYLVLGHSESIHKISRAFKPVYRPGAILYQKQE